MHNYLICAIAFLITFFNSSFSELKYRQEHAKVTYSNPKYVTNVTLFTSRQRRGEPYLTNATITTLYPVGNNITLVVKIGIRKSEPLELRFKLCDFTKVDWMIHFMQKYSNVKPVCPVPAMNGIFYNVEIPPKNFPFILPTGDHTMSIAAYITKTNEKIIEIVEYLHVSK